MYKQKLIGNNYKTIQQFSVMMLMIWFQTKAIIIIIIINIDDY